MPQMDLFVVSYQTLFLPLFRIGYFVFLKTILPLVCFSMKIKSKLLLHSITWLKNNIHKIIFFRLQISILMIKSLGLVNTFNMFSKKRNIFFGIYKTDLYNIKRKIR